MKTIYFLVASIIICFMLPSCGDKKIDNTKYGNCTDDKQNQNEEGVDCGGVCSPCSSCDDGTKNSGETGIDCGGGQCNSCSPACTITPAMLDYTLFPSSSSFSLSGTTSVYGASYLASSSEIDIDFNGGTMVAMQITFYNNFNPITYIHLNETMVFKTVPSSSFNVDKINHVLITYDGNIGFSGFYGGIDGGQLIYITKISATAVRIEFCKIAGGNERFTVSATTS